MIDTNELLDYMAQNLKLNIWANDGAKDEKCWGLFSIDGQTLPYTTWGSRNTGGINISQKDNPMSVIRSKENKGYSLIGSNMISWRTMQKKMGSPKQKRAWLESILGDLPMSMVETIKQGMPKPISAEPAPEHWALAKPDESAWF